MTINCNSRREFLLNLNLIHFLWSYGLMFFFFFFFLKLVVIIANYSALFFFFWFSCCASHKEKKNEYISTDKLSQYETSVWHSIGSIHLFCRLILALIVFTCWKKYRRIRFQYQVDIRSVSMNIVRSFALVYLLIKQIKFNIIELWS